MATIVATDGKVKTADHWPEGTAAGYDVSFQDEDGEAYTPESTIAAKVLSSDGTEIEDIGAIAAASTIEVTTEAATNNIGSYGIERIITLTWTAITTRYAAPGVTQRCEIHYYITDMVGV